MSDRFRKGFFSKRKPSFVFEGKRESRRLFQVLGRFYPDIHVSRIRKVKSFGLNSSNWKISSAQGEFILKRSDLSKRKRLEDQALWTNSLTRSAFPALRFYPNVHKDLLSVDGGNIYCLSYFEKGEYLGASLPRWENLLFHEKKLFLYALGHTPRNATECFGVREFFSRDDLAIIRKIKRDPKAVGLTRSRAKKIIEKFESLHQMYKGNEKIFHKALFHIDIHPLNVLFRGNRLKLLADFDSFCVTMLEISLGFSVYKCARELLVGLNAPVLVRRLRKLQKIFHVCFKNMEFEDLLGYGQMDVMKRLLFIFREMLVRDEKRWRFMMKTQLNGLEEIDLMIRALSGKTRPA